MPLAATGRLEARTRWVVLRVKRQGLDQARGLGMENRGRTVGGGEEPNSPVSGLEIGRLLHQEHGRGPRPKEGCGEKFHSLVSTRCVCGARGTCGRWLHIQVWSSPQRSELERKLLATFTTKFNSTHPKLLSPLEPPGREGKAEGDCC